MDSKLLLYSAFFFAVASFSSCRKEGSLSGPFRDHLSEFSAVIGSQDTKTVLDGISGKLEWEYRDTIVVKDAASRSAHYIIKRIESDRSKAVFEKIQGDPVLGEGPYVATYGTEPGAVQTYTETPGRFYMTATSYNHLFTFSVRSAVLKLNLSKLETAIDSISVNGIPSEGIERENFTMRCESGVDISSGRNFYISLPPGRYFTVALFSDGKRCLLECPGIELWRNTLYPVVIDPAKLIFIDINNNSYSVSFLDLDSGATF